DLFDAREVAIDLIKFDPDQLRHTWVRGQAGEAGVGHVVGARPIGDRLEIDLDDGSEILATVTKDDGLGNIGARAQHVFDKRWGDRLPAGGDEKVARSVDETQASICPLTNVARAKPTIGTHDVAGCRFVFPIAVEKVGTAHENSAVLRQLDLEPFDWRTDIAGPWERTTLSGNDAAGLFRLAVHLDDIDAVHVPERGDLGRQTGATADHQLQFVKAELVQDWSKDPRMKDSITRDLRP